MPRSTFAFSNFTGGELSPRLDGRTDLQKYFQGCKTLENMIVHPHGGATRRPGTQFISEVKTSANATRLIPFEFSTTQTYVLEFGNLYMRVHKDGGQVLEANKTISGITQANPAVVTATSHGYSNGDTVVISGVAGMTQVNGKTFLVADKTTNTFELQNVDGTDINSSAFSAYSSGGTVSRVFELTTPYLSSQVFDLKFAQSADVMFLCHPSHEASKLSRTGHTTWSLDEINFDGDAFLDANTTTTTLTPASASTGTSVNITASATTGINNDQGWLTTDVGRSIKFNSGVATITARTNSTVVVCTITTAFANTDATASFQLGAFSDTTGHPSCVTFFEQRLVFAATTANPQTIFFSQSGDFENMTTGTNATDGMKFTIGSDQVNAIKYIKGLRTLVLGTSSGEFIATASSSAEPITPTNIQIKRQAGYGTSDVDALIAGNKILFVQRAGKKVRELTYDYDTDGYIAPDLTILSEHIGGSGVATGFTQWTYQQEPDSIVWVVRSDGVLCAMTYQRSEQVVAWHRHIMGGAFGSGTAVVESVAAISNSTAASQGEDTLYMIVKRTVNGATRRYVEFLKPFDYSSVIEDAWFLDSALQYSGSAVTSVSGLDHLEGQTVSILANGATHANKTVSDGSITLDRSATKITVGLPYTSSLQTMRIESGSADGSAQGKTKRIQELTIRLFETVGAEVGSKADNTDIIPFRDSSMAMDQAVSLFSGDKQIEFNSDYETDGFVFVKQTQPLPLTVTALYPQLNTYDG